jgi:hypothetical protein
MRLDALLSDLTVRECDITTLDIVHAEGLLQLPLRCQRAREDHQPRRVFIEPLHHTQVRALCAVRAPQQKTQAVDQGVFVTVSKGHADEPGWLVHHDDMRVYEYERTLGQYVLAYAGRLRVDTDTVTTGHARRRIRENLAIFADFSAPTQLASLIPRTGLGHTRPHDICERAPGCLCIDFELYDHGPAS